MACNSHDLLRRAVSPYCNMPREISFGLQPKILVFSALRAMRKFSLEGGPLVSLP